jgi:aryl-alcohol dehydrogenase (NADP+)
VRWRPFGRSGLKVTELCLGTMTFGAQADEAASFAILDRAWDAGVRFLDTADVYPVPMLRSTIGATERIIGRWLKQRSRRADAVLATKAYFPVGPMPHQRGNSRRHLVEACEGSLRRLETDRIDLYLCHGWDPTVPVDETLRALEDLRAAGKVLYTALSNVRAPEVADVLLRAQALGVAGFAGLQPRYNLLYREAEESLLPVAERFGLGVMVYNPLAGGMLSGKYRSEAAPTEGRFTLGDTGETYRKRYWNEANLTAARAASDAAAGHGLHPVTAAIAWTLGRPGISAVIIGASRPEQLDASLAGATTALLEPLRELLDGLWFDLPRRPPSLDTPRLSNFIEPE